MASDESVSPDKMIVFVTGANIGIGFELVAQLLAKGTYHVLLGARSADKGTAAVAALHARKLPGSVEFVQVDISDDGSIARAAATITQRHGRLDALVNNAGIAPTGQLPSQLRELMLASFNTNAAGPAVLTAALADLLAAARDARVVNVSSGAGSIGRYADAATPRYAAPLVHYQASKAALNMVTAVQHRDLGPRRVRVFAFCPGFTQSNLSAGTTAAAGAKPASEAAAPLVEILEGRRDGDVGRFLHADGVYPW